MTEIYTDRCYATEERRENGIYYTSRENILKVINPLFMDELWAEFEEIKSIRGHEEREEKLKAFHDKISRLQFFDPANMPPDLRKAHEALDKAVDLVFAGKPLRSEEERQKVLLKAYEEMTA